ncbi:MAG: RagB/SusD family nutrient uptake outer membrane protein, partial [Algoriella sp.]
LNNYLTINRANRLLEGAKKIKPATDAEVAKYNSIIAQARVLRAFAYLELEKYFAPDMKDDNGIGVMITPDVPSIDDKTPRSTNKEVFDAIEKDLEFASTILVKGTDQFRVDINVVNAIRARVNLYRGKHAE